MSNLTIIAATETESSGDLLSMLGIDIPTLIFQVIAFLILVFVLGKWVYPVFVNIIDKREADMKASADAAEAAQKSAEQAEASVAKELAAAKKEAAEIVAVAKQEASALVSTAEERARTKSEALVAAAKDQLDKDVIAARAELKGELAHLVANATEKVVGETVNKSIDASVIAASLKESK